MHEGKEIAIQILDSEETVLPDTNLVMIRVWNPSTWELSPVEEMFVHRFWTLEEFASKLEEKFGIQKENLLLTKIISVWNFYRV